MVFRSDSTHSSHALEPAVGVRSKVGEDLLYHLLSWNPVDLVKKLPACVIIKTGVASTARLVAIRHLSSAVDVFTGNRPSAVSTGKRTATGSSRTYLIIPREPRELEFGMDTIPMY